MVNVVVNTPQTITVRVNQDSKKTVTGTTTFLGAADVQQQVNQIQQIANNALYVAQNALDTANTKYDKVGGTISGNVYVTGNVDIDNNLTVGNTIFAVTETIDAGTF